MSRFNCLCDYEIRDITCPSTHQGKLVTDIEIDDGDMPDGRHVDTVKSRCVMECPKCYRLWVQVNYDEGRYLPFLPEKEPLRLAEQQGGYRG